jgi:predicted RNA methylase
MKPINLSRLHSLRMENQDRGYTLDEKRARFAALASRHEDGTAPQAVAVHQLFQTPPDLAAELVGLLGENVRGRVLEPSAGLGRILDALEPAGCSEVVAVDSAPECTGALYKQERAGVRILQRDFLSVLPAELGAFDAVAMNPPFTMRADVRHILHALQFLRSGGVLAALCMDTVHREKALRGLACTWRKVPAGAFSKEGTGVGCVLLSIVKP